jgi:hypothetical protein
MMIVFQNRFAIGSWKELNKGIAMRFNFSGLLLSGVMLATIGSVAPLVAQETNRLRPARTEADMYSAYEANANEVSGKDMRVTGVEATAPEVHDQRENARVFTAGGWDLRPQNYLLLARPAKSKHEKERMPMVPPNLHELPVQPYAYGWFGANMDRHPRRSFGVRKSYTQWSFE